jgi:hypothetical protein
LHDVFAAAPRERPLLPLIKVLIDNLTKVIAVYLNALAFEAFNLGGRHELVQILAVQMQLEMCLA